MLFQWSTKAGRMHRNNFSLKQWPCNNSFECLNKTAIRVSTPIIFMIAMINQWAIIPLSPCRITCSDLFPSSPSPANSCSIESPQASRFHPRKDDRWVELLTCRSSNRSRGNLGTHAHVWGKVFLHFCLCLWWVLRIIHYLRRCHLCIGYPFFLPYCIDWFLLHHIYRWNRRHLDTYLTPFLLLFCLGPKLILFQ